MLDQAHDLRQLAQRRERCDRTAHADRPATLVIMGGKGGVGTSTIGLSLAKTMTCNGWPSIYFDADPLGDGSTVFQGKMGSESLVENDAKNKEIFLRRAPESTTPSSAFVIVDVGPAMDSNIAAWRRKADLMLLVTTCETASVLRTFAAVKKLCGDNSNAKTPLYLAVNRACNARSAAIVHYRLRRACRRLLNVELHAAGWMPDVTFLKKQSFQLFGLNFPAVPVDQLRRAFLADGVLNWRRREEFETHLVGMTTGREEMDFPTRRNSW